MPTTLDPVLNYLLYIGASTVMLLLFMLVYTRVTPHREFQLIRAGNTAAACSLGGAVLGFSLTLSSSIQHNASFVMFVMWACAAFLVQVLAYLVVAKAIRNVSEEINANNTAMGLLMGVVSLTAGVINAACLT